ncbi:MAG: hypothetical protein HFG80_05295 [Eubacterium sp.]|nr:hypothetical protein [Eubacterium sp.]
MSQEEMTLPEQLEAERAALKERRAQMHEEKNQAQYEVDYYQEQYAHRLLFSWKKKQDTKKTLAEKKQALAQLCANQERELNRRKAKIEYLKQKISEK